MCIVVLLLSESNESSIHLRECVRSERVVTFGGLVRDHHRDLDSTETRASGLASAEGRDVYYGESTDANRQSAVGAAAGRSRKRSPTR